MTNILSPKRATWPTLVALSLLTACSPATYYQVFETASNNTTAEAGCYVHKNDDVALTYDFWRNGGEMRFRIMNLSSSTVYVDLSKSHLIQNGYSICYWDDTTESTIFYSSDLDGSSYSTSNINVTPLRARAITTTSSRGRKSSITETKVYKPKKVINIPPQSSVIVQRFQLISDWMYDCDFNNGLWNDAVQKRTFSLEASPLTFRNYLVYAKDELFTDPLVIDDEFYVSSAEFISSKAYWGKPQKTPKCDVKGSRSVLIQRTTPYKKGTGFYYTQ